MLALLLAGMLLVLSGDANISIWRAAGAGTLMGLALLFRPMACFGLGATIVCCLLLKKWKSTVVLVCAALVIFVIAMFWQGHWRGDLLANFRYQAHSPAAYGGHLLDWPLRSILIDPFERKIPASRIAYIGLHALIVFTACVRAVSKIFRITRQWIIQPHYSVVITNENRLTFFAGLWLLGNTLFVISLGSPWGFECFHRFTIPAAPALWWFLRPILPRNTWPWLLIAMISAGIAIATVGN